jgi:hypothetical protein
MQKLSKKKILYHVISPTTDKTYRNMENITLRSTSTAQSLGLRERKQQVNEVWKAYSMTFSLRKSEEVMGCIGECYIMRKI